MKEPAARAIGVKKLDTTALAPNPHNPRMLFDKAPLDILKESIARVGILSAEAICSDPDLVQMIP